MHLTSFVSGFGSSWLILFPSSSCGCPAIVISSLEVYSYPCLEMCLSSLKIGLTAGDK